MSPTASPPAGGCTSPTRGSTSLLKELIGDGFINDMTQLQKLMDYTDDKQVLEQLAKIKRENKQRLCRLHQGAYRPVVIDPNSMFDVQVKRLHEYKRQHLNALHILAAVQ